MSGLEIFGATLGALQAAAQIVGAVKDAVDDAKELPSLLSSHRKELKMTTAVVAMVEQRPELYRHPQAIEAAKEIAGRALAIRKHLDALGGRDRLKEVVHQLAKGRQEREHLSNLLRDLSSNKQTLIAIVGVANFDLSSQMTEYLEKLAQRLDSGQGFQSKRVVRNNKASGSSTMVNAPLFGGGKSERDNKDLWNHIDEVVIEDNETTDQAFMVNYANTIANLAQLVNDVLEKARPAASTEE